MPVHPPGIRNARVVEFPRCEHHLGDGAIEVVAVHVDIGELIERSELLQLAVCSQQHGGIPQTDVVDGRGAVIESGSIEVRVRGEATHFHVVEAVTLPGEGDVALDEREFLVDLVGLHRETLDHGGPDSAECHRGDQPESERDRRNRPPPEADVHQEQDRSNDGDSDQQIQRRELCVHVGVGRSEDCSAAAVEQVVPVEPISASLEQGDDRNEHRKVGLHPRCDPLSTGLHLDAPVEVMECGDDEQRDQEELEAPTKEIAIERGLEDVVAEIVAEHRVGGAERLAVLIQEPVLPPGTGAEADEQSEEPRDREAELEHAL